jgi:hypothetical protein
MTVVTDGWDDEELLAAFSRRSVPAAPSHPNSWRLVRTPVPGTILMPSSRSSPTIPPAARATWRPRAPNRPLFTPSRSPHHRTQVIDDSLLGQVLPPQAATIEVQARTGAGRVVHADEIGSFSIRSIPRSRFRLRCRAAAGIDVLTSWVTR